MNRWYVVGGNGKGNWETGGCKIDRVRGGTNISGHAPLLKNSVEKGSSEESIEMGEGRHDWESTCGEALKCLFLFPF